MDILFKNAPKIFIALLSLFLFGCQTMPAGWETSCGIGSSSYAQTEEGFSFGLKKGDIDRCHKGSLRFSKQRAEIYKRIEQDKFYELSFDVKYTGLKGSTVMQLHPGLPSHIKAHSFGECNSIHILASYDRLTLSYPGLSEFSSLGERNYIGQWQSIRMIINASNDKPVLIAFVNGEKAFDSRTYNRRGDVCYYPNHKPSVKLGLYRSKNDKETIVEYKNVSFKKLADDAFEK